MVPNFEKKLIDLSLPTCLTKLCALFFSHKNSASDHLAEITLSFPILTSPFLSSKFVTIIKILVKLSS